MVRCHTASMGWVLWRRHGVHFCLLVVLRFTLLMVRWAGLHAVRLSGLHSLTLQLPLLSRLREGVFKRLSRCAPKIISQHPIPRLVPHFSDDYYTVVARAQGPCHCITGLPFYSLSSFIFSLPFVLNWVSWSVNI